MSFAFEDLLVYQKSLDFAVSVIDIVDELETPRKHFRLIEQLESASSSIALNIAEGKGRFSKKRIYAFSIYCKGIPVRNSDNASDIQEKILAES